MHAHSIPARFFDGHTAARQTVAVQISDSAVQIVDSAGAALAEWPSADVRRVRGSADSFQRDGEMARLVVLNDADFAVLAAHCDQLDKRRTPPGALRRVALWGGGALGGVALLLLVVMPALANWLAPSIPVAREVAFGQMVTRQAVSMFSDAGDAEKPFCTAPEGLAALNRLAARLIAVAPVPYDAISLQVVRSDLVNAFAAPGGQVVVLSGLIDAADGPDELAGVLAHELGHVAARDPTRLALRAAGSAGLLGLVFGDFTGGTVVLAMANQMLQASYTRDAETAADVFALNALTGAGISGGGLADFFDGLADGAGPSSGFSQMLQSHPDLQARAARARAAHTDAAGLGPAMSDADWAALKTVCD